MPAVVEDRTVSESLILADRNVSLHKPYQRMVPSHLGKCGTDFLCLSSCAYSERRFWHTFDFSILVQGHFCCLFLSFQQVFRLVLHDFESTDRKKPHLFTGPHYRRSPPSAKVFKTAVNLESIIELLVLCVLVGIWKETHLLLLITRFPE